MGNIGNCCGICSTQEQKEYKEPEEVLEQSELIKYAQTRRRQKYTQSHKDLETENDDQTKEPQEEIADTTSNQPQEQEDEEKEEKEEEQYENISKMYGDISSLHTQLDQSFQCLSPHNK